MNKNKFQTKDTEYGEGYGNGYKKGVEDQKNKIEKLIEKMEIKSGPEIMKYFLKMIKEL